MNQKSLVSTRPLASVIIGPFTLKYVLSIRTLVFGLAAAVVVVVDVVVGTAVVVNGHW